MKQIFQIALAVFILITSVHPASAQTTTCEYWVAPAGNNANPGTNTLPWATLDYASAELSDLGRSNCTVWVKDGIYNGTTDLEERFAAPVIFRAVNPYKAILQNNDTVIALAGAKNVTFEGFEIRHSSATSGAFLVYGSMSGSVWAENITFRNNILHDSFNEDIVKFTTGVRYITFENNVLYNQGPNEQHMDINSVTDVTIQDNIFFNDFEGSNRSNSQSTKHFIVIKDSGGNNDGMEGAQRITIQRNIFMHYQGGNESFVQVGNDGKPYYEAINVKLENNLMIGDGTDSIGAVFGVAGAKDVAFVNNTVVGNLPANAYAFRIIQRGSNLQNQNISFYNNIWSDPTGTMRKFSSGESSMTSGLALDNNLYWNSGASIPSGDLISPTADAHRIMADPELNSNQTGAIFPRWDGSKFTSGNTSIRQEFVRLVNLYGAIPDSSVAIDKANPALAPLTDILGQTRGTQPDLGSYEYPGLTLSGNAGVPGVTLSYADGTPKTATADSNGNYSIMVPYGWNGSVTPTHPCFIFTPVNRNYNHMTSNQTAQNYTPSFLVESGCADVDVSIGGAQQGQFGIPTQESASASFDGVNSGPVQIESTNGVNIFASEHRNYRTSFSETLGYPDNQLTTKYWFTKYAYNSNVRTWILVANPSNSTANVSIYIANLTSPIESFSLAAGGAVSKFYDGVVGGPVVVQSTNGVNILASEHRNYQASFSETLGYPDNQLTTKYWFTRYAYNSNVKTWILVANPDPSQTANVSVYIGDGNTPIESFSLAAGATVSKFYDGVVGGPAQVVSTNGVKILASEHRNYQASFSETLGYPDNQLTTEYWFTRYAYNANVRTWLLLVNPDPSQTAEVSVYIGNNPTPIASYSIAPRQTVTPHYDGVANGPVRVMSTNGVDILASEHRNYQTSFSETLGYPDNQLTAKYWFTRYAYNANVRTWLLLVNP